MAGAVCGEACCHHADHAVEQRFGAEPRLTERETGQRFGGVPAARTGVSDAEPATDEVSPSDPAAGRDRRVRLEAFGEAAACLIQSLCPQQRQGLLERGVRDPDRMVFAERLLPGKARGGCGLIE